LNCKPPPKTSDDKTNEEEKMQFVILSIATTISLIALFEDDFKIRKVLYRTIIVVLLISAWIFGSMEYFSTGDK
jgi:hypothetical protein